MIASFKQTNNIINKILHEHTESNFNKLSQKQKKYVIRDYITSIKTSLFVSNVVDYFKELVIISDEESAKAHMDSMRTTSELREESEMMSPLEDISQQTINNRAYNKAVENVLSRVSNRTTLDDIKNEVDRLNIFTNNLNSNNKSSGVKKKKKK